MAYLYRHIRLDKNIPFYIGIGNDTTYRRARTSNNRNKMWHNIVNKTSFEVEILLDDIPHEFAKLKEKEFIKLYGRKDLWLGPLVNCTDGGEGNTNWSEIQKIRYAEKRKGYKPTPETIKKLSESHKGKKLSPETIKKLTEIRKNAIITKETREKMAAKLRGRPQPEWQRKILSEAAKRRKGVNAMRKPIIQISRDGFFIKEHLSILHCANELNIQKSNIYKVLVGIRNHCGGFMFKYKTA